MTEPAGSESYRLFVAISPPEDLLHEIEKVQGLLRQASGCAVVRWTNRDQFHLTMKFLGNVTSDHCPAIQDSLREICADFPPLQLTAARVGFFPDSRKPRVIWVGVEDCVALLPKLHQRLEDALKSLSPERSEKGFQGHITLARVKQILRSEAESLSQASSHYTSRILGAWTASHADLVRSELSPQGSRYSVIDRIPFSGVDRP